MDRLLSVFYFFRTGCSRDCCFNSICVTPWYDLPPCPLKQTQISTAVASPDLPFEEYRACAFQFWETSEVIYIALSLAYGALVPSSTAHTPTSDPFLAKDVLALLIIVYSAKHRDEGCTLVDGMPSLLDKILQDATTYFLVLSTGHLLLLFFELFAPVSDHPVDLCSAAHNKLHIDSD